MISRVSRAPCWIWFPDSPVLRSSRGVASHARRTDRRMAATGRLGGFPTSAPVFERKKPVTAIKRVSKSNPVVRHGDPPPAYLHFHQPRRPSNDEMHTTPLTTHLLLLFRRRTRVLWLSHGVHALSFGIQRTYVCVRDRRSGCCFSGRKRQSFRAV